MLAQYSKSETSTIEGWLVNLLSGDNYEDILQDALAIIYLDISTSAPDNHVIAYRIQQWASKSYPDPIRRKDHSIILKLRAFYSRIVMLIEDYISKATSDNAPMAYIRIPRVSSASTGLRWSLDCPVLDHKTLDVLTGVEKHRVIWAFTKFEMLCNLYHPRTYDIGHPGWYNDLLWSGQSQFSTWQKEALHCVYEYINSVYSTLFAKCYGIGQQNFEIPPGDFSLTLAYHYFDPVDCYGAHRFAWLVNELPYLGFDLLIHLLDHVESTRCFTSIKQWFFWIGRDWVLSERTTGFDFSLDSSPPVFDNISGQPGHTLQKKLIPYFGAELLEEESFERYAVRQRAWVFFDSLRLFPQDSNFLAAIFNNRFVGELEFAEDPFSHDHILEHLQKLLPSIAHDRREVPRCFDYADSRILTTFWRYLRLE
ncbi:hypothetical protein ACHAPU_003134 [Fusarium lateritium]